MGIYQIFSDLIRKNNVEFKSVTKDNIEDIVHIILQEKKQGS